MRRAFNESVVEFPVGGRRCNRCDAAGQADGGTGFGAECEDLGWRVQEDRLGAYFCATCATQAGPQQPDVKAQCSDVVWFRAVYYYGWRRHLPKRIERWDRPRYPDRWALDVARSSRTDFAPSARQLRRRRPVEPGSSLGRQSIAVVVSSRRSSRNPRACTSCRRTSLGKQSQLGAVPRRCKETHPDLTDARDGNRSDGAPQPSVGKRGGSSLQKLRAHTIA